MTNPVNDNGFEAWLKRDQPIIWSVIYEKRGTATDEQQLIFIALRRSWISRRASLVAEQGGK